MNDTDENKFLHDLASPLGTAMLLLDSMLESMESRPTSDRNDLEQLRVICRSMENLKKLLEERRQSIKSQKNS